MTLAVSRPVRARLCAARLAEYGHTLRPHLLQPNCTVTVARPCSSRMLQYAHGETPNCTHDHDGRISWVGAKSAQPQPIVASRRTLFDVGVRIAGPVHSYRSNNRLHAGRTRSVSASAPR